MNPTPPTNGLYSILKIAILTAVGAFFGALSMTGVPSTWADAKSVLMPALGAAIAAEVYYLRTTFASLLAQSGGQLPPAPAPSANAAAPKAGQAGYSTLYALLATLAAGAVVLLALAGQYLLALVCVAVLGLMLLLPPRATRWLRIAAACLALTGCAGLFNSVGPIEDCGNRIAADAAKGMSVAQIVEDVAGPCALDAADVMAILLKSGDAKVKSSKAYNEALKAKASLDAVPTRP